MMMSEIAGAAWVLPLTFALQGISAALILHAWCAARALSTAWWRSTR